MSPKGVIDLKRVIMIHIFIINAYAGDDRFSAGLRNHLSKRTDIKYYILHSRSRENETELAREVMNLFEGEDIRIYSCGGSGTFRNVLQGVDDLSKVELAFYPKGLTNDFLKCFGDKEKYFRDIDNLIDGVPVLIDYIETNHGRALNTFSVGIDTVQVEETNFFRPMLLFGKNIPYYLGFLAAIVKYVPIDAEVIADGQKYTGRFTEAFLSNGFVIGGALWMDESADYNDGKGRFVLFRNMKVLERVKALYQCVRKNIKILDKYGVLGYVSDMTVRRSDGVPFVADFDGELQPPQREWSARIIHNGLQFVVPKEVLSDE